MKLSCIKFLLGASLLCPAVAQTNVSNTAADPQDTSPANTNYFQNSLGMRFVPVAGLTVKVCVWETRVKDYNVFREETERAWTPPDFDQGPEHPVVNANWEDATAFCSWLTGRERNQGRITSKQKYRLPTDKEWSTAVGMGPESGKTPELRMRTAVIWPWGHYWPPLAGDGNYGPELKTDAFAQTAPVGSFKANQYGIFDLGGNSWEWCEDWFNEAGVTKVLRGGSYNDAQPGYLLAAYRFSGTMNLANEDIGFRVVLETRE